VSFALASRRWCWIGCLLAAAGSALVLGLLPVISSGEATARSHNSSKCEGKLPFEHVPRFSRAVLKIDRKWTNSHDPMPANDAKRLLRAAWSQLYEQCHGKKLSRERLSFRVHANAHQANKDSSFIAAARSPTGQHAKGMIQMIDPVFRNWRLPHHKRVYSPLDDVLAVVNIQLNARSVISVVDGHHYAHNVLDGRHHGWGFHGGDNPYRPFR
jgi:hypothetical protein